MQRQAPSRSGYVAQEALAPGALWPLGIRLQIAPEPIELRSTTRAQSAQRCPADVGASRNSGLRPRSGKPRLQSKIVINLLLSSRSSSRLVTHRQLRRQSPVRRQSVLQSLPVMCRACASPQPGRPVLFRRRFRSHSGHTRPNPSFNADPLRQATLPARRLWAIMRRAGKAACLRRPR